MIKNKTLKATALTMCLSLLLATPVFAANGQGSQNNMPGQQNAMQNNQQVQQNATQNNQQLSNAGQFMVNQGIIKGDSSGDYSMSNNVKRGDMSLMMVRAFNLDTESNSSSNSSFSDVSQSSYYYAAVNTMKGLGIAQGDGQNFNPSNNMTLQEAILFVERALDSAGIDYSETDLTELFEGRSLSEYATREDVSAILYAVLGEDYLEEVAANTDAIVADTITYDTEQDTEITFSEDDFYSAYDSVSDETISYVKFTLPSSSYGKLYYGYDSSDDYDGTVKSSDKFYYDSDDDDDYLISDVTFVPDDDYTGTVKIKYVGYNTDGDMFTGTVKVTVE